MSYASLISSLVVDRSRAKDHSGAIVTRLDSQGRMVWAKKDADSFVCFCLKEGGLTRNRR